MATARLTHAAPARRPPAGGLSHLSHLCYNEAMETLHLLTDSQCQPRRPAGRDPLRELLTVAAAAELRGVNQRTIQRAIRAGRLPAWVIMGAQRTTVYLIPRRELAHWPRRVKRPRPSRG